MTDSQAQEPESAVRSFKTRLKLRLKDYWQDKRGNIAVTFALCLIPLLLAVGVAVDYSRALVLKERLGQAIDAAALAAGSEMGLTTSQQADFVKKYIYANYDTDVLGALKDVKVTEINDVINVSAEARMETSFMKIFGYDEMNIGASTEVVRSATGLELVMVLDNTGSMSGRKMRDLKSAAEKLVDILYGNESNPDTLKVGLVPFAAAVNVGSGAYYESWLDKDGRSTLAKNKMDWNGNLKNVFDLYDKIPNRSWNGCIEARMPPFDTTDDAPTGNDKLFQPYFAPDEPDKKGFNNNYLKDKQKGKTDKVQKNVSAYQGKNAANSKGPLKGCTVDPVTPMTSNRFAIETAIDRMEADGYTHIPVGLVWGWRLISPGEPFSEGSSYGDDEWTKAIVVLTDGENTINTARNDNGSEYGAYGHLYEGRIGTTSARGFVDKLNANTSLICERIKAQGIRVYAITFNVSSPSVTNLMRNCASEPSLYFNSPSGSELEAAFEAIGRDLNNLRISK